MWNKILFCVTFDTKKISLIFQSVIVVNLLVLMCKKGENNLYVFSIKISSSKKSYLGL